MSKKQAPPMPVFRSPSGRYYEWAAMIRFAQRHEGLWVRAFEQPVPLATYRAVRDRRHVDLRRDDGVLEARHINAHIHDGQAQCDLLIRWVPLPQTEEGAP